MLLRHSQWLDGCDQVTMSSEKTRGSDRFQILTAVLFMTLFAAVFLLVIAPKGNITNFVCNSIGDWDLLARMCADVSPAAPPRSGELVASKIDSACVDAQGLKISVLFGEPLTGTADIQVFSTGPDFFPAEQGMTDTYEVSRTITTAVDQLDLVIPVDSMPVGEKIFGNIVVLGEGTHSQVAYLLEVSDCSRTGEPPSNSQNDTPVIQSATCLPSRQLMIAFEFEKPVLGQYQTLVADTPYQLSSVVSQPALLFFSGEPPPAGPVLIRLISATDEAVVFEESYAPPVCGGN
jgi:hypothetical protein